ncbi:ribosomal protein L11 methyltransferase isoform X2 [Juglans microcarpa x Juglans regia]|uniref:ribosomal protein L11 methyltransferase isoform X2 n=1 Tax=Juglans microcarpa x Juglans regia TaxID=2249226 RepID=UPI001B7F37BE|nr:ribosomal protein L11 methyltransferase isoform X2 [Juglans microcarpa x Juglans regia]
MILSLIPDCCAIFDIKVLIVDIHFFGTFRFRQTQRKKHRMPASVCILFKHLSYIVSRRCLIHASRSPLTLLLTSHKARDRSPWASRSITAKLSTSSSTPTNTESFTSPYLSVHIRCPKDAADMLSEALLCFGASSTSMDEEDAFENSDKESFHPVEVTEGIWVVPEWRTPPNIWATNIILNPGLAFGTGEHPTTKMCLLLLHSLIRGGELVLDYGTGSGVLAIAALKFGAALSVGIDIDPQAITSARQNAALNNMTPDKMQLHLVSGKSCPPLMDAKTCGVVEEQKSNGMGVISGREKYDVVIANILLNPLLDLADDIVSHAKHGAIIGLSGILSQQLPYIVERYSPSLDSISVSEMDGWVCVSGRKTRNLADS